VLGAAAAINTEVAALLGARSWDSLAEADQAVIELDGTANKSRLGANAIVGVSMAPARALAASAGMPLWQWLAPQDVTPSLPVPHFNVVNGGAHAANALDFQEFMIAPVGAPSMAEAVRAGAEVYAALRRELSARRLSTGLGDEGGLPRKSPNPRWCSAFWWRRSPASAIRQAPAACPSRWTWRPRNSASRMAGIASPENC
jgi:enolase